MLVINEVCLILFLFFNVVFIYVYIYLKDIYFVNKYCEILKLDYVVKVL